MLQWDDSQQRFLAQQSVATLLRHCFEWLQHCSSIATLLRSKSFSARLRVVPCNITLKLPETYWLHVLWRKCRACSCSFFFSPPLIFTLVAASISYFPTAARKFSCCSSRKKISPLSFISRSFSRWASLACRLLSLFLCLSLSLYSKSVHMTITLSLIL